ncbi:DNA starvation/stationary phase protection protein Dps [Albidovulum sp.]|uniref:DNA starvation/stationary phase protection protein Dps n=1 Tax=Albidovulum sp. TaxID=1872424 RepID=UPI0039B92614
MPVKGLNDNAVAASVAELNARLADMIALRLALKQAHWNVKGPNFIGIHELFDVAHGRLAGHEDTIAERVQILGGVALGTLEAVAGAVTVEAYPTDLVADRDHVAAISGRMAALGEKVRGAIETVSDAGDEGTMDIFVGLSRALDKDLWFIESHLGG